VQRIVPIVLWDLVGLAIQLEDAAGYLPRKDASNKITVHMTLHLNALDRTWLVALLLLPSSFAQTPHRPTPGAPTAIH
jgi:hypothetical protein